MPRRKSETPLDPKPRDILFYAGDWERLREILSPTKMTPSVFVREMVRRKIREVEARVQQKFKAPEELENGNAT